MTDAPRILLILGDQLSPGLATLKMGDPARDIVVMAEVSDEATYIGHHKKKLVFVFSAMRHFAQELRAAGWKLDYQRLDDEGAAPDLLTAARRAMALHGSDQIIVTEPGEWRLLNAFEATKAQINIEILEDDRFICSRAAFAEWAADRKALRMEYFYREMRKKTGILMDKDAPAGGEWNYDKANRKPPKAGLNPPKRPKLAATDFTKDVMALVSSRFAANFGAIDPFWHPVTAKGAQQAAERFFVEALPYFGDYQDAMVTGEPFLFHSILSPLINVGLLDPYDLCVRAEAEWRAGRAPLNAVEGFVRQILGWREYMRGLYWLEGPDYTRSNYLDAKRPLPDFYWTGETDMACLGAAITQTRDEAYAHHIQRLMITGNFAMLAGIDPFAVHEWYLAVYMDAYEWVEAPNVIGMSQFADGGRLASKPYAASANYISKMSDYCAGCRFDPKARTGPDACPFNALYWDFLVRNRDRLEPVARLGTVYATWDRMEGEAQAALREQAAGFLRTLT